MAKHSGFIKTLSGKVHNVVGGNWNGIDYVRGMPAPKTNRRTTARQEIQRAKFSLATEFFREFNNLVALTFERVSGQTARTLAFGNIINNAIAGVYPDFTIDHSKVLVAMGKLPVPVNPAVSSPEPGKLAFTWDFDPDVDSATSTNNAILVAHYPATGTVLYSMYGGAKHTGAGLLNVPYFSGKEVNVWIAFRSANESRASRSLYLGAVMVS